MARVQRELSGDPGIQVRGYGRATGGPASTRPLGVHEGRVTFYFLSIMAITYVLEFVVIGASGGDGFRNAFVLDSTWTAKPWTLVTSVFAHDPFNFFHILLNGMVLFFFGPLLERRIGSRRFLWLFVTGGALAGLAQVFLYTTFLQSESGVVGASGALFAVLGVLVVLGPRLSVLIFFVVPAPLWALMLFYAGWDILGLMAQTGNIAHVAHLAGLVLGLVVGKRLREQGFKFPGRVGHISGSASGW